MPRTIALFGATGRTGGHVLARLLADGDAVRALVRDRSRLAPAHGLTAIEGDATDPAAVARTLDGTDAAISVLGMADISQPTTLFSDAVKAIVGSMQAHGPRRLVMVAGAGTLAHPDGGFRADHGTSETMKNIVAEHLRNFATLDASSLDWTLLCPGNLIQGDSDRYETRPEDWPGQPGRPTMLPALAAALVRALGEPGWIRHRMGIASV